MKKMILTLSCQDDFGIVAAVTTFLFDHGAFITELSQYGDPSTKQFFLRTEFETENDPKEQFYLIAKKFNMDFLFRDCDYKPKVVILVSKQSHCLNDLLHRAQTGELQIEVKAVISNHPDLEQMAKWHSVPFHYLPLTQETKPEQEKALMKIIDDANCDLVVLARYMQILSSELCQKLSGKAINIHHSFLPSFKGAKPYHQAYDRGVKIIGATAHYVTSDLDEGPIIAQETTHVNHTHLPKDLVSMGCDNENRTLAKAVKLHTQMRVLLDGHKTVIFE
ncbi:MAG: formyltetrahydrofolate deformylase [Rhabdochlamydiaceae bacterium]|nr:formyltetrahydrofolate deformylase [Candidatus Amphrikana amoebophyrae]